MQENGSSNYSFMTPNKIIRSKRKTLSLTINDNAELVIRAPERLSVEKIQDFICLLYTSPSPRDATLSRMPSSA